MRYSNFFLITLLCGTAAAGVIDLEQKRGAEPALPDNEIVDLDEEFNPAQDNEEDDQDIDLDERDPETLEEFWKRRGGGGGGGRGGGGGKGGKSGKSSKSSSKGSNSKSNSAARNNPSYV